MEFNFFEDEYGPANVGACAVCGKTFWLPDAHTYRQCEKCLLDFCHEHFDGHTCIPINPEGRAHG